MLKAVLVDDEPLSLDALEFVLDRNEAIEIIGKYTDPSEALEKVKKSRPDVVFLDVEMPELDGFSAAQEIINMGLGTHIIFATVFEKYALKAFEMDAVDYVVKPFSENRINVTVDRIAKKVQNSQIAECPVNAFVKHNLSGRGINRIAVWRENSIVLLAPEAIIYFTMEEKKVAVHTKDDVYESGSSLAELEEKLENRGFFRCHKSFLINTEYIDKITPWFHSTYMIRLKGIPEQIPVSRYYTKTLKGLLKL
jgi:two-component system LytT family response regulator/two-component system response regulator LytT